MKDFLIVLVAFSLLTIVSCNEKQKQDSSATVSVPKDSTPVVQVETIKPPLENKRRLVIEKPKEEARVAPVKQFVRSSYMSEERAMDSLYKALDKPAEIFVLDNSKDTIIVCAEGTKITIPANCFMDKNKKKVSGPVKLEVREYYSTADMLLASLNSVSDGNLMESGGMLNLQASANGTKLNLSSKKTIKVEMPSNIVDPRMELFYGHGHDRRLNWKKSKVNTTRRLSRDKRSYTLFEKINFSNGGNINVLKKETSTPFKFEKSVAHLRDTVVCSFEMNTKGEIRNYKLVLNSREVKKIKGKVGYYKRDYLVSRYWIYHDSENDIGFGRDYTVTCDVMGKAFYRGLPERKYDFSLNEEYLKKIRKSFKDGDTSVLVTFSEVYICSNEQVIDKLAKDWLAKVPKDTTVIMTNEEMKFYVFDLNNLGWINCDRFYSTPEDEKTKYKIAGNESNIEDVKIVFTDIKSIMQGVIYKGNVSFNNVPKNMDIAVIGMRYRNSKYELATSKTTTSDGNTTLQYLPMSSISEIKDKIAALTSGN